MTRRRGRGRGQILFLTAKNRAFNSNRYARSLTKRNERKAAHAQAMELG
jgi:hypothetical protein